MTTEPHPAPHPPTSEEVYELFAKFQTPGKAEWLSAMGLTFAMGHREGVYIYDAEGKRRLINCHSNGGTFNLGHRNPAAIGALLHALQHLDIGNHHLPSLPRVRLAEKLAELTPGELRHTVFATGGGEAVDLAIKVARRATKRRKVISAIGGYHGHTGLAVATGEEKYSQPFLVDTRDFVRVPFNDLSTLRSVMDDSVAAVILETIPATLGMPVPDHGYLSAVSELCRHHGAVYIADEVQTGLGRTGLLWGIEHYHVLPDMLVTAKGLGGGIYPIAATVMTPRLAAVFADDPFSHISTFGGADVGCAVAECVLAICSAPSFLERVTTVGHKLRSALEGLIPRHPRSGMKAVRGVGMMLGIKFASQMAGPILSKLCLEQGLLCIFAGHDSSVLQFLPPLILSDAQVDEVIERFDAVLHDLSQVGLSS